jgi:hypothetical protein
MPDKRRRFALLPTAVLVVIAYQLASVLGQVSTPSDKDESVADAAASWTPPRTAAGRPDFHGIWAKTTTVSLERDPALGLKTTLSEAEAREFNKQRLAKRAHQIAGVHYDDNIWMASADDLSKVPVDLHTSIVRDPPNGRIPALTPEAQKRVMERSIPLSHMPADGPEVRTALERCIMWAHQGPPMLPSGGPELNYNANTEIVQTAETIVLFQEMIHDARVIPLDGRPHLPSQIRQWLGDSRGHWEGDTLVVETTNFIDRVYNIRRTASPSLDAFHTRGADSNLRVLERFTLIAADTLRYQFTVEDPATWTQSWSGEYLMWRSSGPLYEYACSEGNYGLPNILGIERKRERDEMEKKK